MPQFRVAKEKAQLESSPIIEAGDHQEAARKYVLTERLRAGVYFVRREADPREITVSMSRTVKATEDGGATFTTTTVEETI